MVNETCLKQSAHLFGLYSGCITGSHRSADCRFIAQISLRLDTLVLGNLSPNE
jgi:hypothetical protein